MRFVSHAVQIFAGSMPAGDKGRKWLSTMSWGKGRPRVTKNLYFSEYTSTIMWGKERVRAAKNSYFSEYTSTISWGERETQGW